MAEKKKAQAKPREEAATPKANEAPVTDPSPVIEDKKRGEMAEWEKAAMDVKAQQEKVQGPGPDKYDRSAFHAEIHGLTKEGSEKKLPLELNSADRLLYVNSHGQIVLDETGVAELIKHLSMIYQAVS